MVKGQFQKYSMTTDFVNTKPVDNRISLMDAKTYN